MADKKQKIVATQIRVGEDLYDYLQRESERLCISMNAAMNQLMDDGRRFRNADVIMQVTPR